MIRDPVATREAIHRLLLSKIASPAAMKPQDIGTEKVIVEIGLDPLSTIK